MLAVILLMLNCLLLADSGSEGVRGSLSPVTITLMAAGFLVKGHEKSEATTKPNVPAATDTSHRSGHLYDHSL